MWVYHKTETPKIINRSELEESIKDGWQESPACFLDLKDIGIDKNKIKKGNKNETQKAQQAIEAVEGIAQSINNALNIDVMNKNELETYISEHYSIDLDKRKTLKSLRKQAKKIAGA